MASDGGMEGWRNGGENREASHLADAAVPSQETEVGEKGTRESGTPHLGSALVLYWDFGPGEVIFHWFYRADRLPVLYNKLLSGRLT